VPQSLLHTLQQSLLQQLVLHALQQSLLQATTTTNSNSNKLASSALLQV
jgi:hypothetical protein